MKKLILSLFIIAIAFTSNAQEKGKIRVGFDAGLALPNAGAGFNGDLDIRYNIMDNVNVGVKFNGMAAIKDLDINESASTVSMTTSIISSTLVTSDYYFNNGENMFAPYLGGGLGFNKIINIGLSASGTDIPATPSNASTFAPENKFGGLIRGGFELGHFRMGLEYYIIPSSSVVDINNVIFKTTNNSYLNLTLGFYFGGGKWRK